MSAPTPTPDIAGDVLRALGDMDFTAWDDMISSAAPGISAGEIAQSAAEGTFRLDPLFAFERLGDMLLGAARQMLPFAAVILALAFISSIIERMRADFSGGQSADAAGSVCFLITALPVIGAFSGQLAACVEGIKRLTAFSETAMPALLGLLEATGGVASAQMLHPVSIAATGLIGTIIERFVISVVTVCAALAMVSGLNSPFKTAKLLATIKSVCIWTLTGALSVFAAIITIQGLGSAGLDGVSIRAVRYAIDKYVPVVGGFFKDTYGMLVGSAMIIRNALGVTGVIWMVLLCGAPLISLAAAIIVFKGCSAIIEPMGNERMSAMLGDFAGIFQLLFAVLASVAAICIILIAAVIACGSAAMGMM